MNFRSSLFVLALFFLQAGGYCQDTLRLISLSSNTGLLIDARENKYYRLFPEIAGFLKGFIFQDADSNFYVRITTLSHNSYHDRLIKYSRDSLNSLADLTKSYGRIYDTAESMPDQANKYFLRVEKKIRYTRSELDRELEKIEWDLTDKHDNELLRGLELLSITLTNDTCLAGYLLKESKEEIIFETLSGSRLTIDKHNIKSGLTPVSIRIPVSEVMPDPNDVRLLISSTGSTPAAGHGYVSLYEFLIPFFSYGITDEITAAGGILPSFSKNDNLYYLSPRIKTFSSKYLNVSTGIFYLQFSGKDNYKLLYGTATFTAGILSLTGSAGYGYNGSEFSRGPTLTGGVDLRLTPGAKLLFEVWHFPDFEDSWYLAGIRLFGKHFSVDLGIVPLPALDDGKKFIVPLVVFTYNF